jgi:uncharacterized membrane protein YjgN (DUF898 family)
MSDQQTPVQFTGKGSEYFGIWIVNLLLSIVTLGIYSAWAKVRRKKYFYQNTVIDGAAFDYHANPIAILKGRIIAFGLYIAYILSTKYAPILAGILLLVFFVALPWIITRGLMFNARNSSHRGLRFDFDATYGQAALVYIGYTLLTIVTLGLALPFVMQRTNKFTFNHHKFGATHFDMSATVAEFYKIYLKILGVGLLIGLLAMFGMKNLMSKAGYAPHAAIEQTQPAFKQAAYSPNQQGGFIKVANNQGEAAYDEYEEKILRAENEALAQSQEPAQSRPATEEELRAEYEQMLQEEAQNGQAEMAPIEQTADDQATEEDYLKDLTPAERAEYDAQMKAFEEQIKNGQDTMGKKESYIEKMFGPYAALLGPMAIVFGIIALLIYLAVIFSFTSFIQSRVHNLVWNNTKLDHVGFTCNQRMRDLLWLYLSNTVLLICTLGLATPWAQVRMARYRAERLSLTGETNWDKFVGEKKAKARALGEEIADMFDVDISFG